MKKLFYALSLVLAGGLVANAATPIKNASIQKIPVNIQAQKEAALSKKAVRIDGNQTSRKNVKKNLPATADAYYGNWQWVADNNLSAVILPNEGVMSIEPLAGTDSIVIKGFDYIADAYSVHGGLVGYFKNGRIYIPDQPSSYDSDPFQGDEPTIFQNWTLRNPTPAEKEEYEKEHGPGSADGIGYLTQDTRGNDFFLALRTSQDGYEYLSSVYYEDPDAEVTDDILAQSWASASEMPVSQAGYWWFCSHIQALYLEPFEFNPAEWVSVGTAQFKDAWLNPIFEDDIPAYNVPAYRSVLNENRFLLLDPYGPGTPFESINDSGDEGYLVFDMTDPDCVLFEPFVFSIGSDLFGEGQIQDFYFYNAEGYYYFVQGTDIDQIITVLDQRGEDISYFSAAKRYVGIYNGMFDMVPEYTLATGLSWTDADMSGYIQLPENFDSVKGIIGEDTNAPVQYFNLQGVRVLNPAQGQIVIKRQGNNVQKMIVR